MMLKNARNSSLKINIIRNNWEYVMPRKVFRDNTVFITVVPTNGKMTGSCAQPRAGVSL